MLALLRLVTLVLLHGALAAALAPGQDAAPAPPDPTALVVRGVQLQREGDVAGAALLYEEALRSGAGGPVVRSNLGAAYAALGRYEEAVDQYRQALVESPSNVAIRRNLSLAYYKAGRIAEAAAEAERALVDQPGQEATTVLLADCLFRLGQSARVVALLEPLGAGVSPSGAVSYLLGMALLAEGRVDEAQRSIDRVLREDTAEARAFLAAMHVQEGDCDKALPEIQAALERNASVPLVHSLLGRCMMDDRRSDFPAAIEAFRGELSIDPNHFESNLFLGGLLREGGRPEEALAYAERAARLRPDDPAARFGLGAALVALGRTEEAVPLLESVARVAPEHLPTQMQLAVAYHRLGRTADLRRAREAVGRLQSEGEDRFFRSVSDSLNRLLGKAAEPPAREKDPPSQ